MFPGVTLCLKLAPARATAWCINLTSVRTAAYERGSESAIMAQPQVLRIEDIPNLPGEPQQPVSFSFPKRSFGQKRGSIGPFKQFGTSRDLGCINEEENDIVFCHTCVLALKQQKMRLTAGNIDGAFASRGFSNWKDATISFRKHDCSNCHKEAIEKMITLPAATRDVGEMLSSQHSAEKAQNRTCLLKILSNLRFLARQGCAIRGSGEHEKDSNFYQLYKLRCEDDPALEEWLRKKTEKYMSHEVQNEMLKVMALIVLREISATLHCTEFYSIMVDECTDSSNQEQGVIVLRWVDDQLQPHEEFIGLYAIPSIDSAMLVSIIKDTLVRLNLSLTKLRGQCYDGASSMRGARTGVAKQLQEIEPRAIYLHCYGHSLNLAVSDVFQHCKLMKMALETTHEITKLVKYSPQREGLIDQIKGELAPDSPGVRVLCPTRWTVRGVSMKRVIQNYSVLQELWEKAADVARDTENKARIRGVAAQMRNFNFFFALVLGEMLLSHCDNLSSTLQNPHLSAAEGQTVADMTKRTLATIRADDKFELFWEKVRRMVAELDVSEPQLPRKRKAPMRYESGTAPPEYHSTPKGHYHQIFYEAVDLIVHAIDDRFDQPGYRTYRCLEDLVLKATNNEDFSEKLQVVVSVYGSDIDAPTLQTQYLQLRLQCWSINIRAIHTYYNL